MISASNFSDPRTTIKPNKSGHAFPEEVCLFELIRCKSGTTKKRIFVSRTLQFFWLKQFSTSGSKWRPFCL